MEKKKKRRKEKWTRYQSRRRRECTRVQNRSFRSAKKQTDLAGDARFQFTSRETRRRKDDSRAAWCACLLTRIHPRCCFLSNDMHRRVRPGARARRHPRRSGCPRPRSYRVVCVSTWIWRAVCARKWRWWSWSATRCCSSSGRSN